MENRYSNNKSGFSDRGVPKTNNADTAELTEILDGNNPQALVARAQKIAKEHLVKVTNSQIRNIYGTVKKLQMKLQMDKNKSSAIYGLIILKPKLAYTCGRHKIDGLRVLEQEIGAAIDLVDKNNDRFENFCCYFEALLAYHKYFTEREKECRRKLL